VRRDPGSVKIVDCKLPTTVLGLSFRAQRRGPERELVDRFLASHHIAVPPGCEPVVFREPRLPTGYPDLVIVMWHEQKAARWRKDRAPLTRNDLRLAHYLYHRGPSSTDDLQATLGNSVPESVARLDAAGIVRIREAKWKVCPLARVFAAKQIIAVEAKISEWKLGLEQAHLNTWFASVSYLLVPSVPKGSSLVKKARELGVGVWTNDQAPVIPRKAQQLPCSYVSWLFNEWTWLVAHRGRVNGERQRH
jgi:hypothetical protein